MPTFSAACIKRDLLLKCDFDSYHPQYLDFWIWRQVCFKYPIHFTSDAITYWRRHSKSYDSKENISDITQFLLESNKIIEKENPIPFIEKANIALFKLLHKNRYKIIEYEMEKIYKNTHKNI